MTAEQRKLLGIGALILVGWVLLREGDQLLPMPPDSEFDPDDLREGTLVELEHTNYRGTAKTIAKAHLLEDEDYYEKLASLHL